MELTCDATAGLVCFPARLVETGFVVTSRRNPYNELEKRSQRMIKKIAVEQLQPGMYVHDMNCGWMSHPFIMSRFLVEDDRVASKLTDWGIREVYIDTEKGDDIQGARSEADVDEEIHQKVVAAATSVEPLRAEVPLKYEMVTARKIHAEAVHLIHSIMTDVRLGKQVEMERVEPMVERIAESILRNRDALIILGRIKRKDQYTFHHSVSVCALMTAFMKSLDLDADMIRQAGIGGLLHDIGKTQIPETILNKPGRLTEEEFEIMKGHVPLGVQILEQAGGVSTIATLVAAQHHERYDGSGYPARLKADGLSMLGQLASIVDVYDAITSDRVYHERIEPAAALRKIFEWSEYYFNRELVEHFIRIIGIYPVGTMVALHSGLLGVIVEQGKTDLLKPVVCVVYDKKWETKVGPIRVDLADQKPGTEADRIVGTESAQKWGVDPLRYI